MTWTDPLASPLARLATPEGAALLARMPRYEEAQVLETTSRLRAEGLDPELVAAALTQTRLRERSRGRLGDVVDHLLLTTDGVEQATRPPVARRHAERFLAAGVERVWDLGCGLGLDARAHAEAGLTVRAVERDPEVAVAAAANLAPYPHAEVLVGDVTDEQVVDLAPEDGAWLDPARRTPGVADSRGRTRRLFRLADLAPSWEHVQEVAARCAATGAKLSPGFSPGDLPAGAEAEWVSVGGDVVECAVWWGAAVGRTGVSAVVDDGRGTVTTVSPATDAPDPLVDGDALPAWIGEPDRAVLAAGLAGSLAAEVDGAELDHGVGYVGAAAPVDLPWVRWFEVVEDLPLRAKPVRAWLREQGFGAATIKKRGVPTDVEAFRRELRLRGDGPEVTLVLTRVAGSPRALVVRPRP